MYIFLTALKNSVKVILHFSLQLYVAFTLVSVNLPLFKPFFIKNILSTDSDVPGEYIIKVFHNLYFIKF